MSGAALAGLAVNGEPSDVRFGREHLRSNLPDAKLAAVRILGRFGTAEDVPALLDVAHDGSGDARDEVGICALRLSSTPFDVARELINTNSPKLVQVGYAWLYDQHSREVGDLFEALFDAEDDKDRMAARNKFRSSRLVQQHFLSFDVTRFRNSAYSESP